MIKKLTILFLSSLILFCCGYKKPDKYVIEAERDAYWHNNVGINYRKDRIYYAAIQEFKIAISLSPSTQASAVFHNNLGETYLFINYPDAAKICFEDAIKLYGLNLKYYMNLVKAYIQLNEAEIKIKEFENSENIYDRIKLGILYIETNEARKGVNVLDDICNSEPDLLITPAIRQYIKQTIKEKL